MAAKFYDHVIRNEKDYERIKDYIESNPMNWADDEEFLLINDGFNSEKLKRVSNRGHPYDVNL